VTATDAEQLSIKQPVPTFSKSSLHVEKDSHGAPCKSRFIWKTAVKTGDSKVKGGLLQLC